jgi:ATP-dependent Zn protease
MATLFSPGALAAATTAGESEAAFKQQLAAKQVRSVVINKYARSMRVTLKDGTQVTARYPKKQSEQTAAHLRAERVAVSFVSKGQGLKEARHPPKKPHHKLRYIVGGVLIVVIVLVVAVLVFRRRRD